MPQHRHHLQQLIDDAVNQGAKLLAGPGMHGRAPGAGGKVQQEEEVAAEGQFFPPTVLADVTEVSGSAMHARNNM